MIHSSILSNLASTFVSQQRQDFFLLNNLKLDILSYYFNLNREKNSDALSSGCLALVSAIVDNTNHD